MVILTSISSFLLGYDVCEVRCKAVGDFKSPYFTRFGLMPHGTPCDARVINHMDFMSSPWPRKKGLTPICLEGNCRASKKHLVSKLSTDINIWKYFNIVLVIRKQSPVHFIFMLKKSITNIDCKSNYFWVRDSYFLWILQKQRLFKIFRNKYFGVVFY